MLFSSFNFAGPLFGNTNSHKSINALCQGGSSPLVLSQSNVLHQMAFSFHFLDIHSHWAVHYFLQLKQLWITVIMDLIYPWHFSVNTNSDFSYLHGTSLIFLIIILLLIWMKTLWKAMFLLHQNSRISVSWKGSQWLSLSLGFRTILSFRVEVWTFLF